MQNPLPFAPADPAPTIQLHRGDCLEVMPTLALKGIHMCFADLPYGTTCNVWDEQLNIARIWKCLDYVCAVNAAICMTATQLFASYLVQSNLKNFRYDIVWEKDVPTGFFNANKMPLRKHETILVFYRKLPKYNPQKTPGKPYSTNAGRLKGRYADKCYGNVPGGPRVNKTGDRYPVSVIRPAATETRTRFHPTQKPIALLEWLIKTYTNPGDTVLDPCFGSATTGVACLRTGRNFIGIEKDATYFEIGRKRIAEEQARLSYEVTV